LLILGLVAIAAIGIWYATADRSVRPDLTVTDAQATPVMGKDGTIDISLKIANAGGPVVLASASSPDATTAEFTGTEGSGTIAVPGGGSFGLSSDGVSLRLSGITGDLSEGRLIAVTLKTRSGYELATKARTLATKPMDHSMHGMDHSATMDVDASVAPSIALSATKKPDTGGWTIALDTKNFRFAKDLVDKDHVAGAGHAHIYLNGVKLSRVYGPTYEIGPLPKGDYLVRVTLNTNKHMAYAVDGKKVTATTTLKVD